MRYVVRNNFFGLESRPQNQEGIKNKATPAIPNGEHGGRREKPSEEARALSRSAYLVGGERSLAEASNQEDSETSKAVVGDQYLPQNCKDRDLQGDQVCSEPSKDLSVDSAASAEQVSREFIQNAEETAAKDCHSLDLTASDKITSNCNIYDDEIWESPGAVM